jgi:hypothetical protein
VDSATRLAPWLHAGKRNNVHAAEDRSYTKGCQRVKLDVRKCDAGGCERRFDAGSAGRMTGDKNAPDLCTKHYRLAEAIIASHRVRPVPVNQEHGE